jgi:DNA-binding MarR family transcriptional regulator
MPFSKAEAITRSIRECCIHLDALYDALRHDVGITAAMRAVLEALYEHGTQTVPQIARSKKVTRQHIQTLADKLLANKLIASEENPKDRRSPLLRLSEHGGTVVERMRTREVRVLAEMSHALDDCDVDVALTTLDTLRTYLEKRSEETHRPQ